MRYAINTSETVHGVYYVEAADKDEAERKFNEGDLPTPSLFESIEAQVLSIEEALTPP